MKQLTEMPPKTTVTALSTCSGVRSSTSTTTLGYRIRKWRSHFDAEYHTQIINSFLRLTGMVAGGEQTRSTVLQRLHVDDITKHSHS